ncbi:MAG TPA: hypothetical protein VNO70_09660, partial [Blastocatellia bacterium]|nr:hypothetical protein [Blastocatellia bacterium]
EVWPVGKLLPRPGKVTITYHPPVTVKPLPEGASKAEVREQARVLARKTRERIASALAPESLPEDESSAITVQT